MSQTLTKPLTTRERLLTEGQRLFWARGYSNVTVRQIAQAAEADVALISRYYGSKLGLFEATLALVPQIDPVDVPDAAALRAKFIEVFVATPRGGTMPSPLTLMLMNAQDPEVGPQIRALYRRLWHDPITQIVGDARVAALFSAAFLGMSVAEKTLLLPGIAAPEDPEYRAQLATLIDAALDYA